MQQKIQFKSVLKLKNNGHLSQQEFSGLGDPEVI